jgi:adenylate cyclase
VHDDLFVSHVVLLTLVAAARTGTPLRPAGRRRAALASRYDARVDASTEADVRERGFSEADIAARAGASVEQVRRMASLGILSRAEAPFPSTDIGRVRLALAFEGTGIDAEGIGRVVRSGQLSFGFMDPLFSEETTLSDLTYGDICTQTGLDMELLERVNVGLGLPRPSADQLVRKDDAAMIPVVARAMVLGLSPAAVARTARLYGETMRRLAEASARTFDEFFMQPMLAAGVPEQQVMEAASRIGAEMAPQIEAVMVWLYRRHTEHYLAENVIGLLETLLDRAGVERSTAQVHPAIVFLDLSGYTRLTEEQGDEVSAELALTLAELVQDHSHRHGGRPIKWLGDGVMFHFPEPSRAVVCSLEMVVAAPRAGLPSAHVGIHTGPVISREGDYYGRTVNLASRIAGHARPGEVLVSEALARTVHLGGVRFDHLGAVDLKGLPAPVTLYRATEA